MNNMTIPVDANAIASRIVAVLGVEPQEDYKNRIQRTNRDGVPLWNMSVVYAPEYGDKIVIEIGVAGGNPPEVVHGEAPIFTNLTCRPGAKLNEYGKLRTWAMWECEQVRFGTTNARRPEPASAPAA